MPDAWLPADAAVPQSRASSDGWAGGEGATLFLIVCPIMR